MFAVSGHVKRPGVFEVEYGVTTFRDIIYAPVYAGGIRGDRALKAYIPGGASAPWFFEEHLDLPLEKGTIDKAGSMLGSGAIVVMDETADMVKACHRVVRFFASESCGKCTPCREGTTWLEQHPQAHHRRLRPAERPAVAHGRERQHQPRHRLAARSRPRSVRSARRPCRRSSRPCAASPRSSRPTSRRARWHARRTSPSRPRPPPPAAVAGGGGVTDTEATAGAETEVEGVNVTVNGVEHRRRARASS